MSIPLFQFLMTKKNLGTNFLISYKKNILQKLVRFLYIICTFAMSDEDLFDFLQH